MTDEFGFSDEPATREEDEFAHMTETDFNILMNISEVLMTEKGVPDRRSAVKRAQEILDVYARVWTGSSKIGLTKYTTEDFRRHVIEALIDGKEPCLHGHIAPITDCGVCLAQARINKHVQNPTECPHDFIPFDGEPCPDCNPKPRPCDHTRLDYSMPCPACTSEDADAEELELADKLAKRQAHEGWMRDLGIVDIKDDGADPELLTDDERKRRQRQRLGWIRSHGQYGIGNAARAGQKNARAEAEERAKKAAQTFHASLKPKLSGNNPPVKFTVPPSIPRSIGNEAELMAVIAVLLQKLGGEVELTALDMERIQELMQEGKASYVVMPSPTGFSVTVKLVDPKPLRVTPHNPSGPTIARPTTAPTWLEDDEDLPF